MFNNGRESQKLWLLGMHFAAFQGTVLAPQ